MYSPQKKSSMTFFEKTEKEFTKSVMKGIDECLKFLNSDMELPIDKDGNVIETRLDKVVEAREETYNTMIFMMDEIEINKSDNVKYKDKIISGLIHTYKQLIEIVERPMPRIDKDDPIKDEDVIKMETEGFIEHLKDKQEELNEDALLDLLGLSKPNYSDDKIKSISKARKIATKVCKSIRERVSQLKDAEAINSKKLDNRKIISIREKIVSERDR